jgi:hypothetical protein
MNRRNSIKAAIAGVLGVLAAPFVGKAEKPIVWRERCGTGKRQKTIFMSRQGDLQACGRLDWDYEEKAFYGLQENEHIHGIRGWLKD